MLLWSWAAGVLMDQHPAATVGQDQVENQDSLPSQGQPLPEWPFFCASHLLRAEEFNVHKALCVAQRNQVTKLVIVPLEKTTHKNSSTF